MCDPILYKGKEIELLSEIVDYDDDVVKMGHFIICKKTKEILHTIDWSPYSELSIDDLRLYIELGCPKRIHNAPLDTEDLIYLKKRKNIVDKITKKFGTKEIEL